MIFFADFMKGEECRPWLWHRLAYACVAGIVAGGARATQQTSGTALHVLSHTSGAEATPAPFLIHQARK